jgi:sortase A
MSLLTGALFLAGIGMFTYPFFTDVYTEQVVQARLEEEFASFHVETVDDWETEVATRTGVALTKMVVPDVDVETLVVEGVSQGALRAGAGHYPNTPLPGQAGNVAIAGHRTTYGKPFNRFDELEPGDDVWLLTPVGDHRYVVIDEPATDRCAPLGQGRGGCVTDAKDWGVISPTSQPTVTLTTCHPKGSAAKRLIVQAVLAETLPAGTYEASSRTVT